MVCRETTHPQAAARPVKPIIIEPEAEPGISEAFNWYEDQREGLGKDFMLCLEAAFTAARDRPASFPYAHSMTRRVIVRRFPYIVLFRDTPDATLIIGVFHSSRDPSRIRKRSR